MTYWIAKREAINAQSDMDAAMAYQRFGGRFETRAEARTTLIRELAHEAKAFNQLNIATGVVDALEALVFLATREAANEIEVRNVRWCIREIKP